MSAAFGEHAISHPDALLRQLPGAPSSFSHPGALLRPSPGALFRPSLGVLLRPSTGASCSVRHWAPCSAVARRVAFSAYDVRQPGAVICRALMTDMPGNECASTGEVTDVIGAVL